MRTPVPIILLAGQAGTGKDTAAIHLQQSYGAAVIGLADPFKRFARDVFGFSNEQLWGPTETREAIDVSLLDRKQEIHDRFLAKKRGFVLSVAENLRVDRAAGAYESLGRWFFDTVWNKLERGIGIAPREILQVLGSEWGRAIYRDVWVDLALRTCTECLCGVDTYDRYTGVTPGTKRAYNFAAISDSRFRNEILRVKQVGGVAVNMLRDTKRSDGHVSETEIAQIPRHLFDAVVPNNAGVATLRWNLDVLMHETFGVTRINQPSESPPCSA